MDKNINFQNYIHILTYFLKIELINNQCIPSCLQLHIGFDALSP